MRGLFVHDADMACIEMLKEAFVCGK